MHKRVNRALTLAVLSWLSITLTSCITIVQPTQAPQGTQPSGGNFSSFQSYNYPTYYIRHQNFLGELTQVSSNLDRQDATFRIVPGLADGNCVSFESLTYPGYYLRHQDFRVKLTKWQDSQQLKEDATFCRRPGLADSTLVSFESYNYPGYFLRHRNFHLYIEQDNTSLFKEDTTFRIVEPLSP